jgi:ArsR family metal-binding transcriptional regulator
MNRKQLMLVTLAFAGLVASTGVAIADDIDERQMKLTDRINEAAQAKQLTSKDAKKLRAELTDFNKKKNAYRANKALSLNDDKQLDKSLNAVSQDFEKLRKKDK